ncbi:MAG TPA: hypothetical protein EYP85_12400 [Armatimonadetes bacterium]|nr:hypothetical protein [Armatimonadota bacterium]
MSNHTRVLYALAAGVVVVGLTVSLLGSNGTPAHGQPQQPMMRARRGPGGPGGPMIGGPQMMAFMAGMIPGSIAVGKEYIYVLRGTTLYQFTADDLTLTKKVTLEVEMPFLPPAPGRPRR